MKLLLSLLLALPLIACNNQATTKDADSKAYKSPGKPSMNVELNYTVSKERVAVGETVDVTINFDGNIKPSSASLKTSQQLVLHGDKNIVLQKSSSHQPHTFSVTPMTEGIHLLTVIAEDAATSHTKPFAIRIIAGDKPIEEYLETNGTLETDENGEKIISMPAEEQ